MTEQTRTGLLSRSIFDALNAARDVKSLIGVTEIDPDELDLLDARVSIAEAMNALAIASKTLDREVVRKHPGHTRQSDDWVVVAERKPFTKRVYKGDPHTLVNHVVNTIMTKMGWTFAEDNDPDAGSAADVRDVMHEFLKVWTITGSKLPTMTGLKKLGLNPDDHFLIDWGDKAKVDVMPKELYETIFGPSPLLDSERMPAHSEPF